MTSPYTPRPALKIESGYLVFLAVQKRFPAFIRCHALHFINETDFSHTELSPTPLDFRNAVAKLSANPILGPVEGGVPLIIYLAARGLEEDFKDLADEISEDEPRLFDIPNKEQPIIVAFGDSDAIEDQQLNAGLPARPAPTPQPETTPQPVAPPPPTPEPEPTPALTPEPVAAVETVTPIAEPVTSNPEPTPVVVESVPTPEPTPMPEPVADIQPELQPEPEPAPQPESEPQPTSILQSSNPPISLPQSPSQPNVQQPTVLALGSDYFALRTPDTSGTTVVVWQARRLTTPPDPDEYQILQPTAEVYERLISDARSNVHYTDTQSGELVAIKIGLHGSEADLERAFNLLRHLGPSALRLFYPSPTVDESIWSTDFPAYVVEWVSGSNITDSPAFSEATGLDLTMQILELVQAARQLAPDLLLTDSLKPSNIYITYDDRGAAHPRLIDWNVFGAVDESGLAAMLKRLGETLADLFADIRPESYSDLRNLGLGKPGDPTLGTWDMVSTGTRTIIRRVLRNEFSGAVDDIVTELIALVSEQRARWNDNDPLWQARLGDSSAAKLNWLDIAAVKLGNLTHESRARLDESRVNETTDLVTLYAADQKFYEAVFDLRVANRRYPNVSFFRWALLANTIATLSPEGAYKRLRLDEALTLLSIGEYVSARRALDHGVAFFDEVQFEPEKRERARDYVAALSMCAQALSLADSGVGALNESWNVEEAEAKLALAEDRVGRYEHLAGDLLHGRDALCLEKVGVLRKAIDDFYAKHGRYDPYAARRETTEQARRSNFNRLIERAWKLINSDKPADWSAAMSLLDRAATEFPDLWKEDHDRERIALGNKIGARRLAEGKQALTKGDWSVAGASLAAAMLYPATYGEAAKLQSALWAYQRGEIELQRNDLSEALASFQFAADASSELQALATAQAQKARDLGAALGGDAVSRELGKRFAEQQETISGVVLTAALNAQEQALAKQVEALKSTQAEQAAQQAAAIQRVQAEQEERLQESLAKLQKDLYEQQRAVIRKAEDEQSAEMHKLVMKITDEHTENQKQALDEFRQESTQRIKELQETQPEWFGRAMQTTRKAQEEQEAKINAALKTLDDTVAWMRTSSSKAEAAAESKAVDQVEDSTVKELTWKVEGATTTISKLQGRLGMLTFLNLLTFLALVGMTVCLVAYLFLPAFRSWLPLPTISASPVTVVTAAPAGTSAATQIVVVVATDVPPTAAPEQGDLTLACSDTEQAKSFYDCVVTNLADRPQAFKLLLEPDQVSGFFYSVNVENQSLQPVTDATDLVPGAAQFDLGNFGASASKNLRISLACTSASGCKTTTFKFVVTSTSDAELPKNEVQVTTSYSAP
jgi:hypothetical protein